MDDTIPRFITYIPGRGTGTWRMHATVGHLRNSLVSNGWNARYYNEEQRDRNRASILKFWRVYELKGDGTYVSHGIEDIFKEDFK